MAKTYERKTGFYRHHDRKTAYTGELVNHVTGEVFTPPDRTKQSFVDECDINNILSQYKLSGQIRHISAKAAQGAYQDLPDTVDFQESMNTVLAAKTAFASLPSAVRNRFHNDPAEFLDFMADPKNQEEAIKLGLASAPAGEPAPQRVEIVNPPPVQAETGGAGGSPPAGGAKAP